jgi:hypothetical protein
VRNIVNEMNLVRSLLHAIVNIDGDALVMHAGDKPYVVSPTGQMELASRGLTLEAVNGIVMELLPVEFQQALDELGAVQYTLPPQEALPDEHFTVVIARGGEDIWAEIRRRRASEDDRIPQDLFEQPATPPPDVAVGSPPYGAEETVLSNGELDLPEAAHRWPGGTPEEDAEADRQDRNLTEVAPSVEAAPPVHPAPPAAPIAAGPPVEAPSPLPEPTSPIVAAQPVQEAPPPSAWPASPIAAAPPVQEAPPPSLPPAPPIFAAPPAQEPPPVLVTTSPIVAAPPVQEAPPPSPRPAPPIVAAPPRRSHPPC